MNQSKDAFNKFNQPMILMPPQVRPFIGPGQFIDIDENVYAPNKIPDPEFQGFPRMGKPIQPYTINYGDGSFIQNEQPLGGQNYGSYLYNPQPNINGGGTDGHHIFR